MINPQTGRPFTAADVTDEMHKQFYLAYHASPRTGVEAGWDEGIAAALNAMPEPPRAKIPLKEICKVWIPFNAKTGEVDPTDLENLETSKPTTKLVEGWEWKEFAVIDLINDNAGKGEKLDPLLDAIGRDPVYVVIRCAEALEAEKVWRDGDHGDSLESYRFNDYTTKSRVLVGDKSMQLVLAQLHRVAVGICEERGLLDEPKSSENASKGEAIAEAAKDESSQSLSDVLTLAKRARTTTNLYEANKDLSTAIEILAGVVREKSEAK